jgi:hypothetical protein
VPRENCSKSFINRYVEPDASELATGEFAIDPCLGLESRGVVNLPCALRRLPLRHDGCSSQPCPSKGVRLAPLTQIRDSRCRTYVNGALLVGN